MQPMLKSPEDGRYHSIPEIMTRYKEVHLKYVKSNMSIQVRDADGKYLGNLKYDWGDTNAAEGISGATGKQST